MGLSAIAGAASLGPRPYLPCHPGTSHAPKRHRRAQGAELRPFVPEVASPEGPRPGRPLPAGEKSSGSPLPRTVSH